MKTLVIILLCLYSPMQFATEIQLTEDGEFRLLSNVHLINDIAYKNGNYQALIEVPAGSTAKWEVNHQSGHLEWEFKKGKPRNVKYLGYPGNYGFIPQSNLNKHDGGDGDPLDVIVLGPAVKRGSVQTIRILGALKLLDKGKPDNKIIALPLDGPFSKVASLGEMMVKFPDVINIVRAWFEGYKGSKIQFMGYMKRKNTEKLIEKSHNSWRQQQNAL